MSKSQFRLCSKLVDSEHDSEPVDENDLTLGYGKYNILSQNGISSFMKTDIINEEVGKMKKRNFLTDFR